MVGRWLSPAALDLAEQLLAYDPSKRIMAVQALEAPYFKVEQPAAELPIGYGIRDGRRRPRRTDDRFYRLSTLEGEWHELETKRERAKKRRKLESALPHGV